MPHVTSISALTLNSLQSYCTYSPSLINPFLLFCVIHFVCCVRVLPQVQGARLVGIRVILADPGDLTTHTTPHLGGDTTGLVVRVF